MTVFKRISHRIAQQFTAFVLLLLLLTGAVFFAADYENMRRMTYDRLGRSVEIITHRADAPPEILIRQLPPPIRDRVRVLNAEGKMLFTSNAFFGIPVPENPDEGMNTFFVQNEPYAVLTLPLIHRNELRGYIQVVGTETDRHATLVARIVIYLLTCLAVSAFIYVMGLYFARRSLQPAEQMVERFEQFTQDASHELRTPLATLNSSLDLALKTKEYTSGIESAKEDVKHISILVERLLELARLDRTLLEFHDIDLSAVVEESIDKIDPLAQKQSITISKNILPSIRIKGDDALLKQVVNNLLSNAMKFTGNKGTIAVEVNEHSLRVNDNGDGIDTKDLPHIFDRFYQADDSRAEGGFGLGLALVKRIVELHGWRIEAKNRDPNGASFIIHFS